MGGRNARFALANHNRRRCHWIGSIDRMKERALRRITMAGNALLVAPIFEERERERERER